MSSPDVTRTEGNIFPSTQKVENEPSKFNALGFAVLIIFGVGGLIVAGVGAGGLLHAGSLTNLGQVNSIIMIAIGGAGGIPLLIIGILGFVKTHSGSSSRMSEETTIVNAGELEAAKLEGGKTKKTEFVQVEEPGAKAHRDSSPFRDFETKLHGSPNPVLKNRDCGLAEVQPEETFSKENNLGAIGNIGAHRHQQKPLTIKEQALHRALSFECQKNNLPNVALILEKIKIFIEGAHQEELIKMSLEVADQELNTWVDGVSKYFDDRWAWPGSSGRYSMIRQLITDPNLNTPLRDPAFILAIFSRSQLGNPLKIGELNVAEMLISGFRDQHPALLECQPYNNAFFVEDIKVTHDQAHEERLFRAYLIRKECSFTKVIEAVKCAAEKIGIPDVGNAAGNSHFDGIYNSMLWENGDIVACFRQLKQSIDSEKKFVVPGHTFTNSYGQSVQGFVSLCRILYPKSLIVDANPNFGFVSSTDLAQKIAGHPTVLLEYDICHLWYDVMHFKAMFAGQTRKYNFKDGQFSMIDIVEKVILHIQKTGLKPENAITAQQIYLRLYALADLTILPKKA